MLGRSASLGRSPGQLARPVAEVVAVSVPKRLRPLLALVLLSTGATAAEPNNGATGTYLLKGGTLIDGTGAPARAADVLIRGDRIAAVGVVEPPADTKVIDVRGRIVCPGFIDLHSHSDDTILTPRLRPNVNFLTQGVTTVVTGNCGSGTPDVPGFFGKLNAGGVGTNVIHLVGHGDLRRAALGNAERPADAAALRKMSALLKRALDGGAWGFTSGLIYVPSRYGTTEELTELARVVAREGGVYASHIRDEGDGLLESIRETIAVGRGSGVPVHISHLKATGKSAWGLVTPACKLIEAARGEGLRVTADQYPYIASSTRLSAMVVPHWARQGDSAEFTRLAADATTGARLRSEIAKELDARDGGASIRIAYFAQQPRWNGKDLVSIARAAGTTPLEIVLEVGRRGDAQAISFGMCEADVRHVMARDYVATASDASSHLPGAGDHIHPRAYGTFPRKIRYALDEHVLPLEAAIRSCTGLPAAILGLPDRGTIRPGEVADVLVFDPNTFRDRATFDHPAELCVGVSRLFVNGVPTIVEGRYAGVLAGRPLRRQADGPAALIVSVKRIWTGDPANPWAEAVAVRDGKIAFVGSRADVDRFRGPATTVLEHRDGFAMPGLIDAHGHIASLGASLESIDLRGVDSPAEVARRVAARMKERPGDGWIVGRNWDQTLWPGGEFPTVAVLDAVAPARPVWLTRVDGHAGWANSEALRRAGVTAESRAPKDGRILRDKAGAPTGVFVDGAMELVGGSIPAASPAELSRAILAAQRECLANGLTGVHDAGVSPEAAKAFQALDAKGDLKLRVYGMATAGDDPVAVATRPVAKPGRRFELRAMKLFMDGAMGSRGALLFEPYSDEPSQSGLSLIEPRTLERAVTEALKHGRQVCTHAIGDKANALVLDAYAKALAAVPEAKDARLRIEHAQVVRKEDVARFKTLGVIASMQPSHASSDMRWADARLGEERAAGAYAWRWFLDAGVPIAFGSDFPVEVVNPFWGLYAAITRQDAEGKPPGGRRPEQRFTLEEALRAHTAGSAYAAFAESSVGVLKDGMRADMTVVDRDLLAVTPAEVLKTVVTETVIDGEVVYRRPQSPRDR